MRRAKYTEQQFRDAVANSISFRSLLRKLNLVEAGGNYSTVKRKILLLKIDTSHFRGQGHLLGRTHNWSPKTPLSEILVENSTFGGGTSSLKKRLFKDGLLKNQCYECGITEWRGKQIALELEHKNGKRFDNRIENLSILCPNCHSQTDTFRGRNKKTVRCVEYTETNKSEIIPLKVLYSCLYCGRILKHKCKTSLCTYCCKVRSRKVERPTLQELENLLKDHSMVAVGKMFGVSDNAIRKWIKRYRSTSF